MQGTHLSADAANAAAANEISHEDLQYRMDTDAAVRNVEHEVALRYGVMQGELHGDMDMYG